MFASSLVKVLKVLLSIFLHFNIFNAWSVPSCGPTNQITEWGSTVTPENVWPEYPRPQLLRNSKLYTNDDIKTYRESDFSSIDHNDTWINLNGLWGFQGTTVKNSKINYPLPYPHSKKNVKSNKLELDSVILVPFPSESCLSGVGQTYKHLQYVTYFNDFLNRDTSNTRVLLHFGAIDWQCSVYINSDWIGNHTGGYDSFSFDITDNLNNNNNNNGKSSNELFVSVYDPSDDGYQPNGKQRISAITNPGGDTYTPASGIWQTVWLELINTNNQYIDYYKIYSPTLNSINLNVTLKDKNGIKNSEKLNLTITIIDCGSTFRNDMIISKINGHTNDELINIEIPKNDIKLWDPLYNSPYLYNLNISIDNTNEYIIGYFGIRNFQLLEYNYSKPDSGAQIGIDRAGSDINGYPITLNESDYHLCWHLCNITSECESWAYGIPNCTNSSPYYTKPMCWLKSSIPGTSSNQCRVSGTKKTAVSLQKRPVLNGDAHNNEPLFMAGWLDQSFWPDGIYTAPNNDALKFDLEAILYYGYNGVRLHQKVNPERWYYYADKLGILIYQDMIQKYGGATEELIPYFKHDITEMINEKFNHPCIIQWTVFNEGDCWKVFNVSEMVNYAKSLDNTRLFDTDSGGSANDYHIGDVNDIHTYPYPGDPIPYNNAQYGMIGEYGGLGAFVTGKEWVNNGCYAYKELDTVEEFMNVYINMTYSILNNKHDISCVIYTQITDVEEECDGYLNYDRSAKWNSQQIAMIKEANQYMIENMWKPW